MADKSATDIVMRFVHGDKPADLQGRPVYGECALLKDPDDDFMTDFKPAGGYDEYSNFFEVIDFSFTFNASEDSEKKENEEQGGFNASSNVKSKSLTAPKPKEKKMLTGQFAKWRSLKEDEYKKTKFGIDIESFSFKRLIDSASPVFFKACCRSWTFESAALVKRISRGELGGANRLPVGYLRFDFKDVMLKSVKWSDGEVVVEDCEMVCKEFKVRYKQQASRGDLKPEGKPAEWIRDFHTNPDRDRAGGGR